MAGTLRPMFIVKGSVLPVVQSTWSSRVTHWNCHGLSAAAAGVPDCPDAGAADWACAIGAEVGTRLAPPMDVAPS